MPSAGKPRGVSDSEEEEWKTASRNYDVPSKVRSIKTIFAFAFSPGCELHCFRSVDAHRGNASRTGTAAEAVLSICLSRPAGGAAINVTKFMRALCCSGPAEGSHPGLCASNLETLYKNLEDAVCLSVV